MADQKKNAYYLIVMGLRAHRRSIRLNREVVVGRSATCDLVLDHPSISREHARFFLQNGSCYVEDLDSHNGLLVGEERASWAELQAGDVVDFGPCQITLRGGPTSSKGLVGRLLKHFRS